MTSVMYTTKRHDSIARVSVWSVFGFSRLPQEDPCQVSEIDQGLELLLRRGRFGLKNGAQPLLTLFNETYCHVDGARGGNRGVAWRWNGTRPFDACGRAFLYPAPSPRWRTVTYVTSVR